jgi:hypothetical protein
MATARQVARVGAPVKDAPEGFGRRPGSPHQPERVLRRSAWLSAPGPRPARTPAIRFRTAEPGCQSSLQRGWMRLIDRFLFSPPAAIAPASSRSPSPAEGPGGSLARHLPHGMKWRHFAGFGDCARTFAIRFRGPDPICDSLPSVQPAALRQTRRESHFRCIAVGAADGGRRLRLTGFVANAVSLASVSNPDGPA